MKKQFLLLVGLVLTLSLLGACRTEPVVITAIETVEVEKEVRVVETVEVEKIVEVPVAAGEGETATAAQAESQEYVLGVVLPFTGALGSFGTGFRNGIELAVEQMNGQLEAVNSNIRFTTASADTEGTPDGAAKAVQTVVQTSGAQAIVGPLTTSEVLGAKQFADENQVTIFAPASSGVAGAIPDDFIFRIMYPPDTFAGQAFKEIAIARGYENVVILFIDDPFGNGMVDIFTEQFQGAGGGEVVALNYAPDPPDLTGEAAAVSAEIARLSAEGPTAFFCVCFLGDAQKLLQQAVVDPNLGSVDWLGIENLVSPDILADASHAEFLATTKLTSVSFADTPNPNTQPFIDAYVEKYGEEPGPFTNYAYDVANIAMFSMIMAGNDGAAIQKIVPFVSTHYIGTQVQGTLDANGDQAIANYGIFQLAEDGSDFVQIGSYNGADGVVTFSE
jgi:ABC-type branched-subunit amino acid transport system substrate-binding protein